MMGGGVAVTFTRKMAGSGVPGNMFKIQFVYQGHGRESVNLNGLLTADLAFDDSKIGMAMNPVNQKIPYLTFP